MGGRIWNDAQQLYHPTPASSLSALPAKLAEWKNLEVRCKARSGETLTPTCRNLALLAMCPGELYTRLMEQPQIATGAISFQELENLIMSAVHRGSSTRKAPIHQMEIDENEEFEVNGEIFKLELHNGKRTPVKQNKPASQFRWKMF